MGFEFTRDAGQFVSFLFSTPSIPSFEEDPEAEIGICSPLAFRRQTDSSSRRRKRERIENLCKSFIP
jgi:hypothetical protein